MPRIRIACIALVAMALMVAPSCGGGGEGFRAPSSPLGISTTVLPALLSGDTVDVELELTGGCGGPYVVQVISGGVNGGLPNGLGVENRVVPTPGPDGVLGTADDGTRNAAFLTGVLLEDGIFNFTIQVTDSACVPFLSQTQAFSWNVGVGQVRIVGADPALVPEADFNDPNKRTAATNPSTSDPIDALPTTVYNQFSAIDFTVAGGVPPYSCAVVDDPNDPDDGGLPLGVVIPVDSCSIVGSPVEVLAGGVPFLLTIRVEDSTGASSTRKIQWKIDTPPIIVATADLPDGKAGQNYGEPIQTADGVPPFTHELIDTAGEPDVDLHVYQSPAAPDFPTTPGVNVLVTGEAVDAGGVTPIKTDGADYPGGAYGVPGTPGPYDGHPPEGVFLIDQGAAAGQISGNPRRFGNFTIHYHVYSQLVPNERGQHGFRSFNFDIEPSELPAPGPGGPFDQDPAFTDEGVLLLAAPFSTLPEFERNVNYNPDAGSHSPAGLQLLGTGGVGFDALIDGAHSSQTATNPQEPAGGYRWEIADWHPVTGEPDPAGIDLFPGPAGAAYSTGVLGTTNPAALVRSSRRLVDLRIIDHQLPTANEVVRRYGYSIGPDKVIITQSTTSSTKTTVTGTADYDLMDASKIVRKFEVVSGVGTINDLEPADLTNTHTIPSLAVDGLDVTASDALDELLSGQGDPNLDLVRIAVNPTTYRDDAHAVNPHAARAGQSADHNRGRSWQAPTYQSSPGWQTNVGAVHLPDATGVAHDPVAGVFTDGGRMHAFDSANHFGFFIIRSDATIYVPFATDKSTYRTFGDSMLTARANKANSNLISCQITYSPDGRWGACEITTSSPSTSQHFNSASTSRIVLFSLCGEKPAAWGGKTWQIVEPLPAGGLTGGNYLFAMSMALTNNHLYYLVGNEIGTYGHWRDHWVCRYDIDSGAANGELVPGITGQSSATPVQTPFQGDGSSPVRNFSTFTSGPPSGFITVTTTENELYLYDGWNALETSHAPMPFRVSANGMACAILAGPNNSSSTSGTEVMRHHLFVAYDTNDARQASTSTQYHYVPMGGTRGPTLLRGPSSYRQWGWQSGPATAFEISDDGTRAAFTGFEGSRSVSGTSSSNWLANNQEVFAFSGTGPSTDPWSTVAVPPSSTNGNVSGNIFVGSHNWRFGSLGFTADNNSLFFWAGSPNVNMTSTSSSFIKPHHMEGTYYIIDLSNTTTKQVKSMLARADGGSGDGIKTYTTASPVNISSTSNYSGALGYVMPIGGFYSKNRNFFYCVDYTPHDSSGAPQTLLGFNVSAYASNTINGKTAGEGFEVDNYPNRRPFVTQYYYMPHYALDFRYYAPGLAQGMSREVVAKDTGWVFWAPQYARSGPSNSTSINSFSSGPSIRTYWSAYDQGAEVWGFEPNVAGPATELTHPGLGGDTSSRMIHSLEVTDSGSLLSYIWDDNSGGTHGFDDERIGHIFGISFDPVTGVIDPGYVNDDNSVIIEGSDGRAGEAMAHDSTGRRLFYAYRQGTGGDENDKGIVMALRNADGTITISRFFTAGATSERYDVLYAGR